MHTFSFPKSRRLLKSHEFREISKGGQRYVGRFLLIQWIDRPRSQTKLGITVTKKFGKAHDRNLFKRRLREAFRLTHQRMFSSLHLNIRPQEAARNAGWHQLKEDLVSFFTSFAESPGFKARF